ncbi:MAG: hypothetical protein HRT71_13265, partial [Flavobacteriales bacterium]|nr:hypothetical protein [Flavobacteriales bacterium]
MRTELELIQTIEQYIGNKLNVTDRVSFESKMQNDSSLLEEVSLQEELLGGLENLELKLDIQKSFNKFQFMQALKWGIAIFIALAIATAAIIAYITNKQEAVFAEPETQVENIKPSARSVKAKTILFTPEETGTTPPNDLEGQSTKQFIEPKANELIPSQFFSIQAKSDTIIETDDGIVFGIPENAFLDKHGIVYNGPVSLEVKEALHPIDILKAGLSTTSGDDHLETGGMFYLNATANGEQLTFNPEAETHAQVPTDEVNPGMQLYDGKLMPDGSIDWVNPKTIERYLTPIDINGLNFYPDGYQSKVTSLGHDGENKTFTDSLFYTFTHNDIVHDEDAPYTLNGQFVFKKNWLLSNKRVCMLNTKGDTIMTTLTDKEGYFSFHEIPTNVNYVVYIDMKTRSGWPLLLQVIDHNENIVSTEKNRDNGSFSFMPSIESEVSELNDSNYNGIDPSDIKAIWNDEFQNTNLATREFEERLQVIYKACDKSILGLYVKNLDLPLYKIDSMAALLNTPLQNEFEAFYER